MKNDASKVNKGQKGFVHRQEFAAARARMMPLPIPELIELLGSSELQIRFLAEMCLRDATST